MAEKKEITRISWSDLLGRVEKNGGVPKATVQEAFKATEKEISSILSSERNEGTTVIKTPICAVIQEYIPAHTAKDEKGNEYEYSAAYGITASVPSAWVAAANVGFECTKKLVKAAK